MPSRVRNNAEKPGLAEATPHYLGHRERLRERFLDAGPEASPNTSSIIVGKEGYTSFKGLKLI